MKKILIILLHFCTIPHLIAQIADPNFAKAVRDFCPTCLDGSNRITETGQKLTSLTIAIQDIKDITGISEFSSLISLNCGSNYLTFLPLMPSSLKILFISNNKLSTLNNLPTGLTALYCDNNRLVSLPELPNNLQILNCSYNKIAFLPKLSPKLETLICSHNLLTTLPNLPLSLEALVCANNNIKNLPPLPKLLSLLSCQNNGELICLPKLPDSLSYLYVSKGIICLPNKVTKAIIEMYNEITYKQVNLPICTNIQAVYCPVNLADPTDINKKIRLFPNPTDGEVVIIHKGSIIVAVTIFNYLGQIVRQSNDDVLKLDMLAAGWYLVQIKTDSETVTEKIIKN